MSRDGEVRVIPQREGAEKLVDTFTRDRVEHWIDEFAGAGVSREEIADLRSRVIEVFASERRVEEIRAYCAGAEHSLRRGSELDDECATMDPEARAHRAGVRCGKRALLRDILGLLGEDQAREGEDKP